MPTIVNWSLLREPYNWLIVILMLLIGVMALRAVWPAAAGIGPNLPLADGD